MKHRQCNGQKKKDKHDLQNITQKANDRAKRTLLKQKLNLYYLDGHSVPTSHITPIVLPLLQLR